MFTGIIEETGEVEDIRKTSHLIRLQVKSRVCGKDLKTGDSISVNGCCLTAVKKTVRGRVTIIHFDLLRETWERTNLHLHIKGHRVNLERALAANSRLGGHFVTGHIDATGRISRWEEQNGDWALDIEAPEEVMRYVVFKGSIAVDGISLTVAKVWKRKFRVWIIPHTRDITALSERQTGDFVNLETDLLGKYAEKILRGFRSTAQ